MPHEPHTRRTPIGQAGWVELRVNVNPMQATGPQRRAVEALITAFGDVVTVGQPHENTGRQ